MSEELKELFKKLMLENELSSELEDEIQSLINFVPVDDNSSNERIAELERQLAESKQKYVDRFFNGDSKTEEIEDIEDEDTEEIEVKEVDELFN